MTKVVVLGEHPQNLDRLHSVPKCSTTIFQYSTTLSSDHEFRKLNYVAANIWSICWIGCILHCCGQGTKEASENIQEWPATRSSVSILYGNYFLTFHQPIILWWNRITVMHFLSLIWCSTITSLSSSPLLSSISFLICHPTFSGWPDNPLDLVVDSCGSVTSTVYRGRKRVDRSPDKNCPYNSTRGHKRDWQPRTRPAFRGTLYNSFWCRDLTRAVRLSRRCLVGLRKLLP